MVRKYIYSGFAFFVLVHFKLIFVEKLEIEKSDPLNHCSMVWWRTQDMGIAIRSLDLVGNVARVWCGGSHYIASCCWMPHSPSWISSLCQPTSGLTPGIDYTYFRNLSHQFTHHDTKHAIQVDIEHKFSHEKNWLAIMITEGKKSVIIYASKQKICSLHVKQVQGCSARELIVMTDAGFIAQEVST